MLQGYVGAEMRRANRNLLVTNVVIAAIVLALPVIFSGYIKECLGGPYAVTLESLQGLQSASDAAHTFVMLDIDPVHLDKEYYQITGGQEKKNDYYHFLHVADGRYLIIMNGSAEDPPRTVEGSIVNLSSDVKDKVLPGISGDVRGTPLAVMVDEGSYRGGMYAMIAIGGPLLLLAVWNILKAVQRKGDPLKSPIAKSLAKVGPPEEMAVAVDAEVTEGGKKVGRVMATQSWLIQSNAFNTDLVYLGDVAWAYKSETKHKTYGVTTSRTYATVIHDVHGRRFSFPLKQEQVHTLLAELGSRVPWAIIGYSAELQKAWAKKRSDVLAQVAERKRRVTEAGGTAAQG